LTGLNKVWLIEGPEPELAPVILPVIVPNVQEKLLATDDVNGILVVSPLQTDTFRLFVTDAAGITVMVTGKAGPGQDPLIEVGVTRYSTVPISVLLRFVRG
jgi:hypothetical protein